MMGNWLEEGFGSQFSWYQSLEEAADSGRAGKLRWTPWGLKG